MGENRTLFQLDEPHPSTSFQLDGHTSTETTPLSRLYPAKPQASRVLLPTAGFCVKTLTTQPANQKKVFINVCHTDGIPPPPRDLTLEQLAEVWFSETPGNYRVPMSIAAPHEERDRHDTVCEVYDVAINSTFYYAKVEKEGLFRTFLIQVAVEGVASKYNVNITVDNGVTVLKKRKAMGNIQPHRVQIRSAVAYRKIIEEVSSGVPQVVVRTMPSIPQGSTGIPHGRESRNDSSRYVLMLVHGEMGRTLVGRFMIPNFGDTFISRHDLKLQLGWDRMRVQAVSINYLVDIFIPFFIDTEHAVAVFDGQTDVLTVTVPLMSCEE